MEDTKETQDKTKKSGGASGSVRLSDVFFLTLRHWPWLVASVLICVGVAYLYLLRTPNVYSRSAEILVKSEEQKGKSLDESDFANLGLFQSKTNIQNEISSLKAKDLMEEVVKRLGLDINYYGEGRFHDEVAYGRALPVKLSIADYPAEGSFRLNLAVAKDGKVTISDLRDADGRSFSDKYTGRLYQAIRTPLGSIFVTPSPSYRKGEAVSLKVEKIPLSAATGSYNGRLNVAMSNDKGTVLKLTLADQSVERADEVLNTLIGVYNENWIRDKNQIAVSTSEFINDRLGVIEGELGNVDSDISSYKSANLIPDVEAAASMYMNQNQETQARILEVNNELAIARYFRAYLAANSDNDQLLPANLGLQSGSIQSQIGEYNEQILQRKALVAKSSEKSPLVAQIDDQLRAQRLAIIRTIDNEIVALKTRMKSLSGSEAQTVSKLASNPTQAKKLLSVERQQKVKESLYLFLLQKREENELSQAFTAYNTRIVNKPGASGVPPTPNRRNVLAIAFLVGLAIPFGVTYVRETNNTRVRGRKDVEHLTTPFVGEIPQYGSSKKKKGETDEKKVIVKAGKRDVINESFRVLRTNVEFMCSAVQGNRVIAITSFNPGSGKSFISINLGMTIALKKKRVLVVDGDMRHGSVSAYVGSPETGLADYISGQTDDIRSQFVQYDESADLYVLPVGTIPPNPTELLESARFGQLMEKLRGEFDYVIVDCPPIEVVADAQIIDRYADRTFFIIRAGLFERNMLPELDRLYEEKKYNNMAFILNGTHNEQGRYGYSYSYRYGYGYGYGYGYNYSADAGGKSAKHHRH